MTRQQDIQELQAALQEILNRTADGRTPLAVHDQEMLRFFKKNQPTYYEQLLQAEKNCQAENAAAGRKSNKLPHAIRHDGDLIYVREYLDMKLLISTSTGMVILGETPGYSIIGEIVKAQPGKAGDAIIFYADNSPSTVTKKAPKEPASPKPYIDFENSPLAIETRAIQEKETEALAKRRAVAAQTSETRQ